MEQRTILVVEDDGDILKILKDHLGLDGFVVMTASTGEEGRKLFREHNPDLLILDLALPDIDGIRLCQYIRKMSDVPIIMLTARDTLVDKVRGFECGADDYLVKPFEYLELAVRIKACLRRGTTSGPRKRVLIYGPLSMDLARKVVFLSGRPVRLTRREFDLLDILVSHEGQVLTRDFLTGQLWPNKEVYAWSRALDVHIRRLRQKIEPDPGSPGFIVTHPGVGYRFDPQGGR